MKSVFRISWDAQDFEVDRETFESRGVAQSVIDQIRAAGGGDEEMHVVEYPVYTDAASYFRATWRGNIDLFKQPA